MACSPDVEVLKKWLLLEKVDGELLKKIKYFFGFKSTIIESINRASGFLLTVDDEMYAIGYNNYDNLLALNDSSFADSPMVTNPIKIPQLSGLGIKKLDVGGRFGLALTADGRVFFWGMEIMHLLQSNEHRTDFLKLPYAPFRSFRAVDMACANHYVVFIQENGAVVHWGFVDLYDGKYSDFKSVLFPETIQIKALACGRQHTVMLDHSGQVWSFGVGNQGQLGLNWDSTYMTNTVGKVSLPKPCVRVACGAHSTLFLLTNGEVYACGQNTGNSNLCVGISEDVSVPKKVVLNGLIGDIAATYVGFRTRFGAVSNDKKKFFSWGEDVNIETPAVVESALNLIDVFTNFRTPQSSNATVTTKCEEEPQGSFPTSLSLEFTLQQWSIFDNLDDNFKGQIRYFTVFEFFDLTKRVTTTMVVTVNEDVYILGYDPYRKSREQPYTPSKSIFYQIPSKVNELSGKKIRKILFNYDGSFALSKDGSVFSMIKNINQKGYEINTDLGGLIVKDIAVGGKFILFLGKNGQVYFRGMLNSHSQAKAVTKINTPEKIVAISCGDYHFALLSDSSLVYTVGMGDYGQLGNKRKRPALDFKQVPLLRLCKKVVCGVQSIFFLSDDGDLYACGSGIDVLGFDHENNVAVPEKVPIGEKIVDMVIRRKFTSGNRASGIAVKSVTGKIYAWGMSLERGIELLDKITSLLEVFADEGIPDDYSLVPWFFENSLEESVGQKTAPLLASSLGTFMRNPLYSDVLIKLSNGNIPAHRAQLYRKSKFFLRGLLSDEDAETGELDCRKYHPQVIATLLKYVYGSTDPIQLSISEKDFSEVLYVEKNDELSKLVQELLANSNMNLIYLTLFKKYAGIVPRDLMRKIIKAFKY